MSDDLETLQAHWRLLSEDPNGDPAEREKVFKQIAELQGSPEHLDQ